MKRGLTTNTDTIRRIYRIQDDKTVYYEDSNQNVFTDAFGRHSRHITTSYVINATKLWNSLVYCDYKNKRIILIYYAKTSILTNSDKFILSTNDKRYYFTNKYNPGL